MLESQLNILWSILGTAFTTSIIIGFVGYVFRTTILKYITSGIEGKFNKDLEKVKSELRVNETVLEKQLASQLASKERELDRISSFLIEARKFRDNALLDKRIEAAELTVKACKVWSKLTMAVEVMKIIRFEEVRKDLADPRLQKTFKVMAESLKVDDVAAEAAAIDRSTAQLYLSDQAEALYNAYSVMAMLSAQAITMLSTGHDPERYFKYDGLRKLVEDLAPGSRSGFEEFGRDYAYHWFDWLHEQTIKTLRSNLTGSEQDANDATAAAALTISSQQAQEEARKQLLAAGLPAHLVLSNRA